MRSKLPLLFLGPLAGSLLPGCTWDPTVHPNAEDPTNTLSGEVVVTGVESPSYAVLLAADADAPLPPLGTGSPVSFSTVGEDAFEGTDLLAADYTMTGLVDGDYLITGFMDMDRDFHPTIDAMAGATCGDVVGAHLADLASTTPAVISVSDGQLYEHITVTLGSALTVERPAFHPLDASDDPGIPTASLSTAAQSSVTYPIVSTPIHVEWTTIDGLDASLEYDLEGPYDPSTHGVDTCHTAFLTTVVDANDDTQPDEHPDLPGTGLYDIWPRIGLTFLGAPTDTDDDGTVDDFEVELDEGESWKMLHAVSPAMLVGGDIAVGTQLVTELTIQFVPAAVHTYASAEADCDGTWTDGSCEEVVDDPSEIPTGAWSITAIAETGQTWTVPNLTARGTSTDDDFVPETQGTWLMVEP